MKRNPFYLLAILCLICFSACIKDNTKDSKLSLKQKKVNFGSSFIISDDKADKTNPPFTTDSEEHQIIRNYWGDDKDSTANSKVYKIEDVMKLFGSNDKIVIAVEGIPSKELKFTPHAYDDLKEELDKAEKNNIYYYVVDKASLDREMPNEANPNGILHAKDVNGKPVTHFKTIIGTNEIDKQTWYYLILDAIRIDNGSLGPRGHGGDAGIKIPPPGT
jgi:hypothetical protein